MVVVVVVVSCGLQYTAKVQMHASVAVPTFEVRSQIKYAHLEEAVYTS
jgi:hypothetical protein